MGGFGLAKKQQRPSDTFSVGDIPGDQLANLATFTSGIGRKMRTASLKQCHPFINNICN